MTQLTDITSLAEVHHLILQHLKHSIPVKLLRLNHSYYDELVPSIYRCLSLNKHNVLGILAGWVDGYVEEDGQLREVDGSFKLKALRCVEHLYIDDWKSASLLERIGNNFSSPNVLSALGGVRHLTIGSKVVWARAYGGPNFRDDNFLLNDRLWSRFHEYLREQVAATTITINIPFYEPHSHSVFTKINAVITWLISALYIKDLTKHIHLSLDISNWEEVSHLHLPSLSLYDMELDKLPSRGCFSIELTQRGRINAESTIEWRAQTIVNHYLDTCTIPQAMFATYHVYQADKVLEVVNNSMAAEMPRSRGPKGKIPTLEALLQEREDDKCACGDVIVQSKSDAESEA